MLFVELLFVGISLSIDAFSLAISIGINNKIYKKYILYTATVGLFHFIMPIIGFILKAILNHVIVLPNKLIFILVLILMIIGIILEKNDNKTYMNPFLFSFSVSLDSFMIGVSLDKSNLLTASLIFSCISFIFTYFGFKIANKIRKKFSSNLKFISLTILFIILVYNILI